MKYRATRSFYGDLGSVRRNQELMIADERLAKALLAKSLIVRLNDQAPVVKKETGNRKAAAQKSA